MKKVLYVLWNILKAIGVAIAFAVTAVIFWFSAKAGDTGKKEDK